MHILVAKHEDGLHFGDRVRPLLMEHECENCFILGVIGTFALTGTPRPPEPAPLLVSIEADGAVVGVAVQTRPIAMVLTRLPIGADEALVEQLAAWDWPGRGFTGPVGTVDALA